MTDAVLEGVDVLDPPKKIIYVAGEALDFTFVPTRYTLKSLRILDEMQSKKISEVDGMDKIIEIIAEICSKNNPIVTADWLLDNTNIDMIAKMGQDLAGISQGEQETKGDSAKN